MIRALALAAATIIVAVCQASAAPLFSVAAATPTVVLVFLGLVALYRGETTAMVITPAVAVAEAWTRGLSPGLLLVAYVPLVPLLGAFDPRGLPLLGPGGRLLGAVAVTGAWARVLAAGSVVLAGASFAPGDIVGRLLLPGILLDLALAGTVYGVFRVALGEPGRRSFGWR